MISSVRTVLANEFYMKIWSDTLVSCSRVQFNAGTSYFGRTASLTSGTGVILIKLKAEG